MQRRFRKQLFALVREARDERDLHRRFEAFMDGVLAVPPAERPYADEVRDTLRGLSLRKDLADDLHRRYDAARLGRASAAPAPASAAH